MDAAQDFYAHFVAELKAQGHDPAAIRRHVWRPHAPAHLRISGEDRDRDFERLTPSETEIAELPLPPGFQPLDTAFYRQQKLVLILVPGFTHETLKNYSWHEQFERPDSQHHIAMLHPGTDDGPTREQVFAQGDGLKLLYLRYPRSNADSRYIVPSMFAMLRDCASLRHWIANGHRVVFVGYSYGAPLALELLAGMNAGEFRDPALLAATCGYLGVCGDIGGSHLANDVLSAEPRLLSIRRLIDFCRRHPLIARLVGLGTAQLLADMEGGVRSLGHEVRQAKMRAYQNHLPAHLHYFSISALMPLDDYRRRWWQFNFDDWAMYRQALVTDPMTIYHDGQVAMPDHLLPAPAHLPESRRLHLGAVRTHHWGVSYRTFNLGRNRFPRAEFYRALLRTMLARMQDRVTCDGAHRQLPVEASAEPITF